MKKIFMLMMVLMLMLTSCGKYDITISEKKEETVGSTMMVFTNDGSILYEFHGNDIKVTSSYSRPQTHETQPFLYTDIDKLHYSTNENSVIIYQDNIECNYKLTENSTNKNKNRHELINEIKNKSNNNFIFIIQSKSGVPLLIFSGNEIKDFNNIEDNKHFYKFKIDNKKFFLYNVTFEIIDKSLIK